MEAYKIITWKEAIQWERFFDEHYYKSKYCQLTKLVIKQSN